VKFIGLYFLSRSASSSLLEALNGSNFSKTSHDRTSYETPYLHLILVLWLGLIGALHIGFVFVFARTHGSICGGSSSHCCF